jgi:hypothetical protein
MEEFKNRSFKRLIREYEFLLEDYDDVCEIHKQANAEMSAELNKVKPKEVFEADYLEEDSESKKENESGHNDKDLKKLFRKIVFICHPDKAKAADNQDRKTQLARYYEQAVIANDECNWALMVVIAIKLDIKLPDAAEAQVEKIQEDTNVLRMKINAMTQSYVWQWYQAEEEKRKQMIETYMNLLTKSLKPKVIVNGKETDASVEVTNTLGTKLILGVGHPRTGTGYTAKLLQSWGLDVGHETLGNDGTVDWSLVPGGKSLWQDVDFKDYDWNYIIYCVRDPRMSIPSIVYTEDIKSMSKEFRLKSGVVNDFNPIVVAIESILKWDKFADQLKPNFTYRIEDQGEHLFKFLETEGLSVQFDASVIGDAQNTREHPAWDMLLLEYPNIRTRYKNMINAFCEKHGYANLF